MDSLKDEWPDLILLDIMMPDMDSLEVCSDEEWYKGLGKKGH